MSAVRYSTLMVLFFLCISCGERAGQTQAGSVVDMLNREAMELRFKDIYGSKSKSFEALRLIEEQMPDNYGAKAQAWNNIAYSCFLTSYFDSSRVYLNKVRQIDVPYANREIEEAITYITEARLFLRECKYAEAFTIYDSTIVIFKGAINKLKYNDLLPLKKYDHHRFYRAKSDYLIGNAVLGYYYRNTELLEILESLDRIKNDDRLHIDTTQLAILHYTYAGSYQQAMKSDVENFYNALNNIKAGLDLMAVPGSRNDYYLANFYQITGDILFKMDAMYWSAEADRKCVEESIENFKEEYLIGKYRWSPTEVNSKDLSLRLLEKADSLFHRYDDSYQNLASCVHIGNYHLSRHDVHAAWAQYTQAIAFDSAIMARKGEARIWRSRLYSTLLKNAPDSYPRSELKEWFDIYSTESAAIAENTKEDYDAQRGQLEAEESVRRSLTLVFLALSICVTVTVLLYFLNRQNKKLKKARSALKLRNEELEENRTNLESQYETLRLMQKKLIEQKRMELLTYVVRGISHELSQPLGSITQTLFDSFKDIEALASGKGGLTDLQYRTIVDNLRSDLTTISRSKNAISELVMSFRNMIKDNIMDPIVEFNLKEKLDDIVKVIKPNIKSNVNLEVECSANLIVCTYPLLFSQVITNLISNSNQHAFPYSDDPGNTICIVCGTIGQNLIVKCADNGIGIPESEFDRLCQPFVSKKQSNLGLGLSLVKNIVEQYMKGDIGFESDEGLTVTITIPDCLVKR